MSLDVERLELLNGGTQVGYGPVVLEAVGVLGEPSGARLLVYYRGDEKSVDKLTLMGYDRPMMKHTTKLAAAALALAALGSACQSHSNHDLSTTSTTEDTTEGEAVTSAPPAEAVPMRHGESRIYGDCPSEDSCQLEYDDGAWYVDGERVEGVSCPTEDSCTPMYHPDEDGFMIHEITP